MASDNDHPERQQGHSGGSNVSELPTGPRLGLSGRALAREIFRAASPEEFVQELPSQALYLAVRGIGLESAADILALVSPEQYKSLLAFELWSGDQFNEDHFWRWAQVLDQEGGLEAIDQFIDAVDSRLLTLLVGRYVRVQFFDEPTDLPPDAGYYTPDRGSTWLKLEIQDPERHKLFGRIMALVFERDSEYFYRLLTETGYITGAELEEDAYGDRCRRLQDEGMPDQERSFHLNTPITLEQLERLMAQDHFQPQSGTVAILPLVFSLSNMSPLSGFLADLAVDHQQEIEAELALLANAGIVFYGVDIAEPQEVGALIERIRGAVNIGLERLIRSSKISPREVYEHFGVQKIYQLGLSELRELQRLARRASPMTEEELLANDLFLAAVHQAALERFPQVPAFVHSDGSIEMRGASVTDVQPKAFTHLALVETVNRLLEERLVQ